MKFYSIHSVYDRLDCLGKGKILNYLIKIDFLQRLKEWGVFSWMEFFKTWYYEENTSEIKKCTYL